MVQRNEGGIAMTELELIHHLQIVLRTGCDGMENRVPAVADAAISIAYQMIVESDLRVTMIPIDDVDLGSGPTDFGEKGVYVFGKPKLVKIKILNEREILDLVFTFIDRAVKATRNEQGLLAGGNLRYAWKVIKLYTDKRGI